MGANSFRTARRTRDFIASVHAHIMCACTEAIRSVVQSSVQEEMLPKSADGRKDRFLSHPSAFCNSCRYNQPKVVSVTLDTIDRHARLDRSLVVTSTIRQSTTRYNAVNGNSFTNTADGCERNRAFSVIGRLSTRCCLATRTRSVWHAKPEAPSSKHFAEA